MWRSPSLAPSASQERRLWSGFQLQKQPLMLDLGNVTNSIPRYHIKPALGIRQGERGFAHTPKPCLLTGRNVAGADSERGTL